MATHLRLPQARPPTPFVVAIHTIHLACKHSVPGILNRMLYEVLSSGAFWGALDSVVSGHVSLPREVLSALGAVSKDQYRRVSVRETLRARWRDFLMQGPEGTVEVYLRRNVGGSDAGWCCEENEETRKGRGGAWCSSRGVGGGRPIRYDFIAECGTELREGKGWSRGCLERKGKAWEAQRME